MPYFSNDDKFIAVPADFIRNHLPQANPTFVKVYIYLLMLASENARAEFSEIADTLGLLESDLMLAIKYWESEGVIFKNGDAFGFSKKTQAETVKPAAAEPAHPRPENLAAIIESDQSLSDMFAVSQEILQFSRLFFKQFIGIVRQLGVDLGRIAVAQLATQQTALHHTTSQ